MFKLCANKITSILIHNNVIDENDYELYSYGFETLIAFIVNILVILSIGFIFDKFSQTLLFLVCYCPIRQFTGGYHAENYRNCLLVFITIFLINITTLHNVMIHNLNNIIIALAFISYIGIYFLAPIEHRNNLLSHKERKNYKKIAITLSTPILIFSVIGINFKTIYEYSLYSSSAVICIFIMLNLAIIKKYKGGVK